MDTGFFDMLHDSGDINLITITKRINVDFNRRAQITVDQNRTIARYAHGSADIVLDLLRRVDDLHRLSAKDIGRADHNRIADLIGDGKGFGFGAGKPVRRLAPLIYPGEAC